jgi:hypothetical protein
MRDLKPHCDLHFALAELIDLALKIGHAVNQDGLIALEMLGQQQSRRVRVQPHHRHTRPERLDREDQFCARRRLNWTKSAAASRLGM